MPVITLFLAAFYLFVIYGLLLLVGYAHKSFLSR